MEPSHFIRNQVSSILDFNQFVSQTELSTVYDDDQLATLIKGAAYERTKQRILEFTERCEQTLSGLSDRVSQTSSEFDSLSSKASREHPGNPPSNYGNNTIEEQSRYFNKVEKYNNQVEFHNSLVNQANRAKERYEDAVGKHNEKKAELEEQIQQKQELLKPALDQDIITIMGKLQQLTYDNINNKNNPFTGFLLSYLAKKIYVFLYDRIESTDCQRTATDIFKKLNDETELIFNKSSSTVSDGFHQTAKFLQHCYLTNKALLENMKKSLSGLPQQLCADNEPKANDLLELPSKYDFQYKHLIDPEEIDLMLEKVLANKYQLELDMQVILDFITTHALLFDQIEAAMAFTAQQLAQMNITKVSVLDPIGKDLYFAIGIFDEDNQERFMNKYKPWLQAVQSAIENELNLETNLTVHVRMIANTELLTLTAQNILADDQALLFFLFKEKLNKKLQDLADDVKTLELIIADINELPKKKSEEFSGRMALLLNLSLLPVGNIAVLIPIISLIKKYGAGLKSQNPFYISLRETQSKKLMFYFYIHLILVVSSSIGLFIVPESNQVILLGCTATYIISAVTIYAQRARILK